jgi:hypothetical protein
MIQPKTISEQMQYSTVRLVTNSDSKGTGFIFQFKINEQNIPIIVTNKHVINDNENEEVNFFLHSKNKDGLDEDNINIKFKPEWYFHDDKDLCFCFFAPLLHQIKDQLQKDIFFIPITEDLIWDHKKLEDLSAIEDIIMVGYPIGLWNEKNNLPLFRKGITASHPAFDFNNKNIGVVDMACFPGSSGSPIFILNETGFNDKNGNMHLGAKRIIFLGILFQGPQLNAKGELIVEEIPTQQKVLSITPLMINLGYYIKAIEIFSFKKIIEDKVNSKSKN